MGVDRDAEGLLAADATLAGDQRALRRSAELQAGEQDAEGLDLLFAAGQAGGRVPAPAPPERVWEVLIDCGKYPEWHPFIRTVEGEPVVGSRLKVRIEPPGRTGMTFKPTVRAVQPARELCWLGRLFVPGLFDGEHRMEVEPLGGGRSRFVQSERFSGLPVAPFGKTLGDRAGFRGDERSAEAARCHRMSVAKMSVTKSETSAIASARMPISQRPR